MGTRGTLQVIQINYKIIYIFNKIIIIINFNYYFNNKKRMRRGTDESHIESMGEASDPIIVKNGPSLL
jgi:hypothetical protein